MSIIKHIAALLLLVSLPISATGLSINVQKCNHKGTLRLAFFAPQEALQHNNCCCSGSAVQTKSQNESCGCNDLVEFNLHSCCDKDMNQDAAILVSKFQSTNNAECSPIQAKCCSTSEISIAQTGKVLVTEKVKMNFEGYANSSCLISKMQYDFINNDKCKIKVIQFPLKEPNDFIISYIHTTSQSDDESDIPAFDIC